MKILVVFLLTCGAGLAAIRNCKIVDPICLHVFNTEHGNLTIDCSNECALNEIILANKYEDYKTFDGRCFVKMCGEDAKKVINLGTELCVNFLDGEPKKFSSEQDLNAYLCNNEDEIVSSIPGSSKC